MDDNDLSELKKQMNASDAKQSLTDRVSSRIPSPRKHLYPILFFAACLVFLYFVRPWYQPLVYDGIIRLVTFWQYVTYAIVLGITSELLRANADAIQEYVQLRLPVSATDAIPSILPQTSTTVRAVSVLLAVLAVLSLFGSVFMVDYGTKVMQEDRAQEQLAAMDNISQPPETDLNNLRVKPRAVSEYRASSSINAPTQELGNGDTTRYNGSAQWSYMLNPEGLFNTFARDNKGIVYSNMTVVEKDAKTVTQRFKCGPGQLITDDAYWVLHKNEYLVEYKEHAAFGMTNNGTSRYVVPMMTHDLTYYDAELPSVNVNLATFNVSISGGRLPVLVPEPRYAGVSTITPDCQIHTYNKTESATNPYFDGQNMVPYDYAMFKVETMNLKNGILNTYTGHAGMFDVANVPAPGNSQPFTLPTEHGRKYLVSVTPYSSGTELRAIYVLNSQTAELSKFTPNASKSPIGPGVATTQIMKNKTVQRYDSVHAVESIPMFHNGTMYWQVQVTPQSNTGVTTIGIVNAYTGEVEALVDTSDGVRAFLTEKRVPADSPTSNTSTTNTGDGSVSVSVSDSQNAETVLVIKNKTTGETVRTVTLDDNETVVIKSKFTTTQSGNTTQTGNTTA